MKYIDYSFMDLVGMSVHYESVWREREQTDLKSGTVDASVDTPMEDQPLIHWSIHRWAVACEIRKPL